MNLFYKLSSENPENHLLDVEFLIKENKKSTIEVQLPAWRPGRYELGNFSKNIQKFEVVNSEGYPLEFEKLTKDRWRISTKENSEITVKYTYYAKDLNAGSTYVDDKQLYVNPVNSLLYVIGREEEECKVQINFQQNVKYATSLRCDGDCLIAKDYHELADSPFIVSDNVQHYQFKVDDLKVHLWFQGEVKPDWKRLEYDFTKFTESQVKAFNSFVSDEFHFLFQITPYRAYHGVEHLKSTVILLGPSYDVFKDFYTELLGVSSHELYHCWNIKTIRPKEMLPYDYSKENYFTTGYVAEGVTTYMGDQFLYRSKVFDTKQYIKEFNNYLKKHFDNFGRRNYSVAQSSFDLWLDGYVAGVPNRKVSIYTEGCLLAFVLDVLIIKYSNNKHTLDDVMQKLYSDFALKGIGYTDEDYQVISEEFAGVELDDFFENYLFGTEPYQKILNDSLNHIGFDLKEENSSLINEQYGLKGLWRADGFEVTTIAPDSNAEIAGFAVGDKIKSVNSYNLSDNLSQWMSYFNGEEMIFEIERPQGNVSKTLKGKPYNGFLKYTITEVKERDEHQQKAFETWLRK